MLAIVADRAAITHDVMSPIADKGHAVRQVQERLGVMADQTMVFGDYLNALGMMSAATCSFAMTNAHALLKERAAWTAPTNSANGVVRTVRTVIGEMAGPRRLGRGPVED